MIHKIYFIDDSGKVMLKKNLKEFEGFGKADDLVISGFLTAFTQLAETTVGEKLKVIHLHDQRIYLEFFSRFFIVIITDYGFKEKNAKKIIFKLAEEFSDRYQEIKFVGRMDIFDSFLPVIDEVLGKYKTTKDSLKEEIDDAIKIKKRGIFRSLKIK